MPSPFTYPAFDLRTMAVLDPLPYTSVSFGQLVNQSGGWAGALPIDDPRVQSLEYLKATRTGRTALFVDYLGELVWGGIIWTRRYKDSEKKLQIGALEFGSYFRQRLQAADYETTWEGTGKEADPMAIAMQVVEEALAVPAGNIAGGITLTLNPTSGSGQKVSVSYPATQLQTIDSIVSTLAQMGYTFGFDYGFSCAYLPGTSTPSVTMNFYYPRQGRFASESGIVIMHKDLLDFDYDEDSTKQADKITEVGSGINGLLPVNAEAYNVLDAGYPLLEVANSYTQVNTEDQLANIAISDLSTQSWPVTTPRLELSVPLPGPDGQLDPAAAILLTGFEIGDDLLWNIDPVAGGGENMCPRFPNGMSFEWRIIAWNCTVADAGVSKLELDLGLPPTSPANVLAPAPPLE